MNKERVKTFILVLLIASSLFLTKQIWFNEKLWSTDYNFFVSWQNNRFLKSFAKMLSFVPEQDEASDVKNDLLNPLKYIVNVASYEKYEKVYTSDHPMYHQITNLLADVYTKLLKGQQEIRHQRVSEQEWFDVLGSTSSYIYVDFGVICNTKMLGQILGVKDTLLSDYTKSFRESIVYSGDNVSNDIIIYIKNGEDNTVNKFYINYDKTRLDALKAKLEQLESPRYAFAFQLGFADSNKDDKKGENKIQNKILYNPGVIIPVDTIKAQIIKSHNILDIKDSQKLNKILNAFGYNTKTNRQYVEMDNTIVYTENFSTLKVRPNGLIEYKAVQAGKGLKLSKKASNSENNMPSLYESLMMSIDFMEKVGEISKNLRLTGIVENAERPGVYTFYFDYYHDGRRVVLDLQNSDVKHAVEVEIVKGTLHYYRQLVRSYEERQTVNIDIPIIQAVDNLYRTLNVSQGEIRIEEIYLGYTEDGSGMPKLPQWFVRLYNNETPYKVSAVHP